MTLTTLIIVVTALVSLAAWQRPALLDALIYHGPSVSRGQWWRLVTHGFIHGDGAHLLFNMITLYFFGRLIEGHDDGGDDPQGDGQGAEGLGQHIGLDALQAQGAGPQAAHARAPGRRRPTMRRARAGRGRGPRSTARRPSAATPRGRAYWTMFSHGFQLLPASTP